MNVGLMNKPRKPGATKRVWEIADDITTKNGRLAQMKEVRERVVAEGGNPNTAQTQYYYWKAAQEPEIFEADKMPRDVENVRFSIGADGRFVIPAEMRAAMRLGPDGVVSVRVADGELRVTTPSEALRRVQDQLKPLADQLKRKGISVVDELIAERREEARREAEE